jgi:ribonuclease HI
MGDGSGGVGAVVRNWNGEAIAGVCMPLKNLLDATTAEAKALHDGLNLTESLGCVPVIVESDSLEIVKAFTGTIQVWSPCSAILAYCFQIAHRIGAISIQNIVTMKQITWHTI